MQVLAFLFETVPAVHILVLVVAWLGFWSSLHARKLSPPGGRGPRRTKTRSGCCTFQARTVRSRLMFCSPRSTKSLTKEAPTRPSSGRDRGYANETEVCSTTTLPQCTHQSQISTADQGAPKKRMISVGGGMASPTVLPFSALPDPQNAARHSQAPRNLPIGAY